VIGDAAVGNELPGRAYPPLPRPEPHWPALATVVVAIALQLLLPRRLTAGPSWLLPVLEALLLVGLIVMGPRRLVGEHKRRRQLALSITAIVSIANVISLIMLSHLLLHRRVSSGDRLIVSGVLIWLTNVLIFGLWYWEADRGGPGRRAAGPDGPPDCRFVQMTAVRSHPANWRPMFLDYV
jgi:hypothetical protein